MTKLSLRLYPDFSSNVDGWELRPARYFLKEKFVPVGKNWDKTQLLSLTKQGVIDRDIDSGVGKYPASFEGYQLVEPGNLVFCLFDVEETPRTIGLVKNRGMITSAYTAYQVNESVAYPRFLEYLFVNIDNFKRYRPFYSGLRNTIPKGALLGTKVSLPPLEEQKAIADFLDRELAQLDALAQKMEKFVTLIEERLHSEFVQATTWDSDPARRDGWSVKKLGSLFKAIGSGTTPTASDEANFGGETPWVTTGELRENLILETQKYVSELALRSFSALRIYPAGSLVLALYGATIGRLAFLGVPATVNQACCVMANPRNCEPRFIYYALQASRDRLMAAAVGSGQPNISQEIVRQFKLPLPSVGEQRMIASNLDRAVASAQLLIETAQKTIDTLGLRRQALVNEAVTGKIDVRGDN